MTDVVNGAFSERFAAIVGACGKECIRLDVPLGAAVEPEMLRDALKRTPVDAVTCVHSETSTGVLQDVAGYAEVVQEFDDVLLKPINFRTVADLLMAQRLSP